MKYVVWAVMKHPSIRSETVEVKQGEFINLQDVKDSVGLALDSADTISVQIYKNEE